MVMLEVLPLLTIGYIPPPIPREIFAPFVHLHELAKKKKKKRTRSSISRQLKLSPRILEYGIDIAVEKE